MLSIMGDAHLRRRTCIGHRNAVAPNLDQPQCHHRFTELPHESLYAFGFHRSEFYPAASHRRRFSILSRTNTTNSHPAITAQSPPSTSDVRGECYTRAQMERSGNQWIANDFFAPKSARRDCESIQCVHCRVPLTSTWMCSVDNVWNKLSRHEAHRETTVNNYHIRGH